MHQPDCDTCTGSRSRRALKKLLERLPNITTSKAARDLDISRPFLVKLRREMQAAGCVTTRAVDGRTQGHTERRLRNARSWSNTPPEKVRPLIATLPGEVEHLLAAHGPRATWGYPIGSWWMGATP